MSKHIELDNARNPEQLRRMQEHAEEGRCHFCPEGFATHTSPVWHKGNFWFITKNDFPYAGAVHHFLIVCKRHVKNLEELTPSEQNEFWRMPALLESHLQVEGYSLFVRSGDMKYTGATLNHLHFHFLVGAQKPADAKFPDDFMLVILGYQQK